MLDLVELLVDPRQELLARQERLDVERPQEVARRAGRHALPEAGAAQHAAQRVDEQREAEALVRHVRAAERRQRAAREELLRVGGGQPGGVEDQALGHRLGPRGRDPHLLHRDHRRGDVEDHGRMALGRQPVGERVGAEHRRAAAGRRDQRVEVRAREADQSGLGREPDVGRGDQQLPVPHAGDGHALALARPLDAPLHRLHRRAGPAPAVAVEQQRAVGLAQDAHLRARVQRALGVQAGQQAERGDAVVAVAAQLGVDEQPRQAVRALRVEAEPFEGAGQAAPQVVDCDELHRRGVCLVETAPAGRCTCVIPPRNR